MKFTSKQIIYFYVVLLFIFTFLLVSRLITAFKTNEFDYFRLGLNATVVVLCIFNIVKRNKLSDN